MMCTGADNCSLMTPAHCVVCILWLMITALPTVKLKYCPRLRVCASAQCKVPPALLGIHRAIAAAAALVDDDQRRSEKIVGKLKGAEGETCIRVLLEGESPAIPRKSSSRFLNNCNAEFALKQHLICAAKLPHIHRPIYFYFHFSSANIKTDRK